ncbi:hypothetical protein GKR67_14760 [Providencia alcalifaciens]|uniref:Type II toxin-antitoxin system HigB family toxin n=1 Tax=Providencia alcalifaciens TaxID=126385 RepID=A0AAW9VDN5_9GAMM|nr:hypothetical protein [Providencia alcalifaciens]
MGANPRQIGNSPMPKNEDNSNQDIKGNDYRLIVAIAYQRGWMFVKFIGTHKEYDKIDPEKVNLE